MADPLLEIEVLNVACLTPAGAVRATPDLSFRLDEGEILGLAAESGSGKSTIARLISRFVRATGGRILLDGEHLGGGARAPLAYRRRVQMIFQDPFGSLNPVRTVAHHIERPRGTSPTGWWCSTPGG